MKIRVARSALGIVLALVAVPVPLQVPGFTYGMIWHVRTDAGPAQAWLRHVILRQMWREEAATQAGPMSTADTDHG